MKLVYFSQQRGNTNHPKYHKPELISETLRQVTTLYVSGFDWDLKSGGEPSAIRVKAVGLRKRKQER